MATIASIVPKTPADRPFADAFAKAGFWFSFFVPVFLLLRLPELQHEAAQYAQAAVCPPESVNRTDCRSQIDAQVINVKCASAGSLRDQVSPPPSCVLELRVDNQTRFLDLPSAGIANRPAPARLQVEMFRGLPTAAVLDGKLVRRYGSPDRAVQTMKNMGWLWLGIWLLCSVYLWRRNRALRLGAATSA